jgi:hypothetical protein
MDDETKVLWIMSYMIWDCPDNEVGRNKLIELTSEEAVGKLDAWIGDTDSSSLYDIARGCLITSRSLSKSTYVHRLVWAKADPQKVTYKTTLTTQAYIKDYDRH